MNAGHNYNALQYEKGMKHELLKDFDTPLVYGENLYSEFE